VSSAAPFDKLANAPAWTREACATGPMALARPAGWVERVNAMVANEELERLRSCVRPSRPFARRRLCAADSGGLGLESTPRSMAAKKAIASGKGGGFAGGKEECPRSVPLQPSALVGRLSLGPVTSRFSGLTLSRQNVAAAQPTVSRTQGLAAVARVCFSRVPLDFQ
jgi:hypothetical protein